MFVYCFLDRFQYLLTTEENYFGFKKGISCSHAIYTARGFIDGHYNGRQQSKHVYDTIQYDSVYLTCSKKLRGSQLSPPHGTNKKLKSETKNKTMSMIGPVQSRCHEGNPVGKRSLRWEGFVEKVGFEPGMKE